MVEMDLVEYKLKEQNYDSSQSYEIQNVYGTHIKTKTKTKIKMIILNLKRAITLPILLLLIKCELMIKYLTVFCCVSLTFLTLRKV